MVSIWQAFISVEKKKQAPAIFLTLTSQAREAVLVLDVDTLTDDDETCSAREAYETFEKFVQSPNMSISDYVIQFEQLYTPKLKFIRWKYWTWSSRIAFCTTQIHLSTINSL